MRDGAYPVPRPSKPPRHVDQANARRIQTRLDHARREEQAAKAGAEEHHLDLVPVLQGRRLLVQRGVVDKGVLVKPCEAAGLGELFILALAVRSQPLLFLLLVFLVQRREIGATRGRSCCGHGKVWEAFGHLV